MDYPDAIESCALAPFFKNIDVWLFVYIIPENSRTTFGKCICETSKDSTGSEWFPTIEKTYSKRLQKIEMFDFAAV